MAHELNSDPDNERETIDTGHSEPAEDDDRPETGRTVSRRRCLRLAAATAALGIGGVGGASADRSRGGIVFDRVIDAVEELGADPTGAGAVNRQLAEAPPHALIRFPEGEYAIDGRVDLVEPGRIGFESIGNATFIGTEAESGLNVISADAVYYGGFTHADGEGSIRHRFDGAEVVRVNSVGDSAGTAANASTGTSENQLEILANKTTATYDVTVSGWIHAVDDDRTPPDLDVSGGCAEGTVTNDTHTLSYTGAITAINVTGDAEVRLNGIPITIDRGAEVVDPRLTNVVSIGGTETGGPVRYEFTAVGDVAIDAERATRQGEGWEKLARATEREPVTGRVEGDVDAYRSSGGINGLEVSGLARVSIGTGR